LLLAASLYFYFLWSWHFPIVLFFFGLVNFFFIKLIAQRKMSLLLWIGIGFNIIVLAFFKLMGFYTDEFARALSLNNPDTIQFLFPVGLSYMVVEAISVLVDAYNGRLDSPGPLSDFLLYFAYFPKLISGPVERAREFLPKLAANRVVDNQVLAESFTLIVIGFFRKIAVADVLNTLIPEKLFDDPGMFSSSELALWLLAYSFYLYNDFAGYTNIVRGVSGFFGIQLSLNFQTPYFSRNFTEFWNRWHMSLSFWLRDYIYFPLSRGIARRYKLLKKLLNWIFPPVMTMFVSALWHGANWHMLFWGGLHGFYQVVERIPSLWGAAAKPPQSRPIWRQMIGGILVFTLAVLAWVPFRTDLPTMWEYWGGMLKMTVPETQSFVMFIPILPSLLLDRFQYAKGELGILKQPMFMQSILLALAVMLIFIASQFQGSTTPFIYQGF